MSALRDRLPSRRPHWLYRFECDGQSADRQIVAGGLEAGFTSRLARLAYVGSLS